LWWIGEEDDTIVMTPLNPKELDPKLFDTKVFLEGTWKDYHDRYVYS